MIFIYVVFVGDGVYVFVLNIVFFEWLVNMVKSMVKDKLMLNLLFLSIDVDIRGVNFFEYINFIFYKEFVVILVKN